MRPAAFARTLFLAQALLAAPLLAEGRSIIVLDASGSMWGQIDGRAKLEIAREALATVLAELPPETELGLMAYGHREKGSCGDIELVVPPAAGTAQAIGDAANAMKFLGKTPLTESVRRAAQELKSTEAKATVILITDGIETCEADPCALGAELEASGVDFTAHVVGFGLTAEEGAQVSCLAENTGGKYIEAKDAGSLVDALKTTVVVADPEPEPEPEPAPEPEPVVLAENVDPILHLIEGGAEPEAKILGDTHFDFFAIAADGTVATETTATIYGASKAGLPPGKYMMRTSLHSAVVTQEVEIADATNLSQPVAVLDAGILQLTMRAAPGADPDPEAFWELNGPDDVNGYGYQQATRVFPAGEYGLTAKLGAAVVNQSVVIDAGQTTVLDLVIGVGVAVVKATYTEGMLVEGGEQFVEILGAQKDIDGNRKSAAYTYGAEASFDLPPGDYVAVVSLGATKAEAPFSVKVGERTDITVPLNAGVAAFTTPGDEFIEVLAAKTDINGNRASLAYSYGPAWQTTLPAGDYIVRLSKADKSSETALTVTAGERSEVALTLP